MSADSSRGVGVRRWKQIGYYLNISERTAKDWEAHDKLPVDRLAGA